MELLDHAFEPFECRHPRRVPPLSIFHGAFEGVLAEACDVDRRVRTLYRLRADERFGNVIEATIERNGVFRPEREQGFEEFVGARPASFEPRAGGLELVARP